MIRGIRALALCVVVAAGHVAAAQSALDSLDDLGSSDRATVERAVAALEHAPAATPDLADALFAAGRACEDTLVDPPRALALYDRIVRELPDARVATAARKRAELLRAQVGGGGEHAQQATELARLVAEANTLAPDEIVRRGDALAAVAWPGAPEAALWLAEWLRRAKRFDEAQARYDAIVQRWPGSEHATLAIRGAAGCAIEAGDWARAEALARQLPTTTTADQIVRDDLLEDAARGRSRHRWLVASYAIAFAALLAMIASLVEAALRGGRRRPRLRPPIEVAYLAPIAAVLVGVALTTHPLIAPAVIRLVGGGLVLAWLSGATLELLRARGREVRARAIAHVAVCVLAVAALGYISVVRDSLLDMVVETVRFGPE
ncbi:MAG TPA: tetratricopeptide repeat protein [Kofleriaceae bacterium]|nr:tetratricopeptide repeat protein [Kofleriaceae bacterium]